MNKFNSTIFFSFIFLITIISCEKNEIETPIVLKDGTSKIYVKDEFNELVPNATVILYGANTDSNPAVTNIYDTVYTNAEGFVNYTIKNINENNPSGVVVLDIKAQKLNKIGQGIIKIEAETINEETVFIQP